MCGVVRWMCGSVLSCGVVRCVSWLCVHVG